jgi:hypothetical protein
MDFPLGSAQRKAAEEHVSACAHCRTELALLQEFVAGNIREDEKESVDWIKGQLTPPAQVPREIKQPRDQGSRWWGKLWSPGYAAALAVAAALIVFVNVEWRRPASVPGQQADVMRSTTLRAIAPVGELDRVPEELRWSDVPGAARYSILVTEVDLTPVFQGRVGSSSIPLPEEVRKILVPGKVLQWTVIAEDASGRELATTGVQKFFTKPLQTN